MRKIYVVSMLLLASFAAHAQFPAPYCTEAYSSGVEPITNVTFAGINNTSVATTGTAAHQDFTSITGNVQQGGSYLIEVQGNTDGSYSDYVALFADWNHDGDFADAGESYNVGVITNSTGLDGKKASIQIVVPALAAAGSTRIRVSKKFFTSAAYPSPCNTDSYGQAEDYTLTVTVSSCALPLNLVFSNVAIPNATITWTAASGITSYQYAITTSSTAPASGTATSATMATVGNLPAASALFAYVRSVCSPGVFSPWVRKTFIPCTNNITPANGATNVPNPVTFNWAPIAGVSNYEILLSTNNGASYPITGVFGAPPLANARGLSFNTTYKWYVRGVVGADTAATTCASNATTFTTQANDDCASPATLSPNVALMTGNETATQSLPPVKCNEETSIEPVHDVWYSVNASSNGKLTITLTNASDDMDAVLVAYTGTCNSLTNVGCADFTGEAEDETLSLTGLAPNQPCLIRVYGFDDEDGIFTLTATYPTSLPVTGVMLSGVRNGSKAQLSWQTLTEVNNAGFELQRSADGRTFSGIASIASKATGGNSTAAINYSVDDAKPFSGANYYRLKQTDKDGKLSYSNIVYLKGIAVNSLTLSALYPNPASDVLKAAIQSPTTESITFVITDMMGKTISRQVSAVVSGDNTVNIKVANLPSGSYLLKATCRNGCETAYQKFTKQ